MPPRKRPFICMSTMRAIRNKFYNAKYRCCHSNNKAFNRYGGRGILFKLSLDEFEDYLLSKYSESEIKELELDRVDNNGNYEIGNIRLISRIDNMKNTRINKFVEYQGNHLILSDAVRIFKSHHPEVCLGFHSIFQKLKKGMSFDEILATHLIKTNKQSQHAARNSLQNEGTS